MALSTLARFSLLRELQSIITTLTGSPTLRDRMTAIRRAMEIITLLGGGISSATAAPEQPPPVAAQEPIGTPDAPEAMPLPAAEPPATFSDASPAARFFNHDPNRKPSQRKRDNAAAVDLLNQIRSGSIDGASIDDGQKAILARYSGLGGNLVSEGVKGSDYEYFTPTPLAAGTWGLLKEMGFAGGKVLDPCGGVGVFGATAPASAAVDAIELSETSGQINGLVNQRPGYNCTVSNFEAVAASTPDEVYDAVVANVPFGGKLARGENYRGDPKYQDETLEGYFILRSLEKLKPGGLAAFICPPRVVSSKGGKEESVRFRASLMAEFMGAYRLPSHLFMSAGAETIVDLLVLRKHSRDTLEKVEALELTSASTLREANVLWGEFVDGGYFSGEGKRFVLGEFQAKDSTKFRDVDRVISTHSAADIGKLLRKFGGSLINWALLDSTEPDQIVYNDGDTITQAGQMLQMRGGVWEVVQRTGDSPMAANLGAKLATPLQALSAGLAWGDVAAYIAHMTRMSQTADMPAWLLRLSGGMARLGSDVERTRFWMPAVTALAVADVRESTGRAGEVVNHLQDYPELSAAMQRNASDAGALPTAIGSEARDAARVLRIHYTRKGGFDAIWRGEVEQAAADTRSADQRFEAAKYAAGGQWVTREQAAEAFGADFDPIASPEWCVSADGTMVSKADDYFIGNLADMLLDLRRQAEAATDDTTRGKLLAMMEEARRRVPHIDVSKTAYNLASPFVTLEEKADFLRRTYGEGFHLNYDGEEPVIRYDEGRHSGGYRRDDEHKMMKRLAYYVQEGTVTLQGTKFDLLKTRDALVKLRRLAMEADEQFGVHCRASQAITDRMDKQANDPAVLTFPQTTDTAPISLPGWKLGVPPDGVTPHPYQYAEIRRRGRFFGGVNGYAVGLGKSFTALACVQHAHNVGIKRRTAIVVPNSVLSNWQKEARVALENMDECLFVGLRTDKNGKPKMDTGAYDADLVSIASGKFSKIFLTFEAFRRLRLRDETLDRYIRSLGEDDASLSVKTTDEGHVDAKSREKVASRGGALADAITKGHSGSAPYLEDLGIDSVVIDEAHCFPAGTLVDGVPIEQVKIGDFVSSFNHETGIVEKKAVTNVMRRRAFGLVRVTLKNGKSIACTHDHQFFVNGLGYVAAEFLNSSYNVVINNTGTFYDGYMQPLRQGVRAESHSAMEAGNGAGYSDLLREVVRDGVEAREFGEAAGGDGERIKEGKAPSGAVEEQLAANSGKHREEPAGTHGSRGREGRTLQGSRWEWLRNDEGAGNSGERSVVGARVRCENGAESAAFDAAPLQDRLGSQGIENSHRSGWAVASEQEGAGSGREKDGVLEVVGVDRVEVLECGGDGRFGGVCPDGYVYDVTVDGNHNFFAEGILVHNCFKNAVTLRDFKGAKFLSVSPASAQGSDAQAKAAFIRGLSPRKDGVLLLTATPITNSPAEIYSMLSLAVGHDRVNAMAMGVQGPDQFMAAICDVQSEEDETIDGISRDTRVFRGLRNVGILRRAIGEVMTIETAETAGQVIQLPDADERPTPVALPDPPTINKLQQYKAAYRYAVDKMAGRPDGEGPGTNRGSREAFDAVQRRFNEPLELIGHPFNMIRKMSALIIDPDLDGMATFYVVAAGDEALAEKVLTQFNALKITEERARRGPHTPQRAVVGEKIKKVEGDKVTLLQIQVGAVLEGGRICLDSIDPAAQDKFEALAEKAGLDLDVTVPPKLAAMLENFRKEQSSPRGVDDEGKPSPIVKQIIFCDLLPMLNKIKRILAKHAGVSPAQIAIVTGKKNNEPEQIIAVQNGFNAHGEENQYRVIIANEKAEVGINLQRGTQAIHHLTVGWTPDSLTQRNGRGVRQGNKTATVTVYHYDADGTFDAHKRRLVGHKAAWIDDVMDMQGKGSVEISGQISAQQQEALMETVGDADAMLRFTDSLQQKERAARQQNTRDRQSISIKAIKSSRTWLKDNSVPADWAAKRLMELWALKQSEQALKAKVDGAKSEDKRVGAEKALQSLRTRMDKLRADINEGVDMAPLGGGVRGGATPDADALIARADPSYSKKKPSLSDFARQFYISGKSEKVGLVEGSALHADYAAEVANTQAVIEAAKEQFKAYSDMDGGIPARVVDLIAEGKGSIHNGVPLVDGTILFRGESGSVRIVIDGGTATWNWQVTGRGGASTSPGGIDRDLDGLTIAYPGTPEYEVAAARAAAYEDDMVAKYPGADGRKFADLVPEIASRRRSVSLVPVENMMLPAPLFPVYIGEFQARSSPILQEIRAEQAALVREIDGNGFVDPSVALADLPGGFSTAVALRERCEARGVKVPASVLLRFSNDRYGPLSFPVALKGAFVGADDIVDALQPAKTIADAQQAARAWVVARHPSVEFLDVHLAKFSEILTPAQTAAFSARLQAIDMEEKAARADALNNGPDDEMVGITGKTFAHKDMIKNMSSSIAGEMASMHGKGDTFQWNVRRKVWKAIVEKNPGLVERGILVLTEYRK